MIGKISDVVDQILSDKSAFFSVALQVAHIGKKLRSGGVKAVEGQVFILVRKADPACVKVVLPPVFFAGAVASQAVDLSYGIVAASIAEGAVAVGNRRSFIEGVDVAPLHICQRLWHGKVKESIAFAVRRNADLAHRLAEVFPIAQVEGLPGGFCQRIVSVDLGMLADQQIGDVARIAGLGILLEQAAVVYPISIRAVDGVRVEISTAWPRAAVASATTLIRVVSACLQVDSLPEGEDIVHPGTAAAEQERNEQQELQRQDAQNRSPLFPRFVLTMFLVHSKTSSIDIVMPDY